MLICESPLKYDTRKPNYYKLTAKLLLRQSEETTAFLT